MNSDGKKQLLCVALLIVCVAAAFWPTLSNGFTNWDDSVYITENPAIRSLAPANIYDILSSTHRGLYKPLVFLSYALEYHFFRLDPFIYHFDNLLLHIANTLLVCLLLQRLGAALLPAFLAALLFGIHPLRVESVAWLAERKDMLYSLFMLAAMLAYLKYRNSSLARYNALSVLLFIFSLMSKAAGIILPVLLLLFDWLQNRKLDRKMLLDKLPHFAAALLFAAFNMFLLEKSRHVGEISPDTLLLNIPVAAYGLLLYVSGFVFPVSHSVMRPYPANFPEMPLIYWLSPLILAGVAAPLLALRNNKRLLFGPAFFAAAIIPFLQWVPIQPGVIMEHLSYIPSIGLAYLAAELYLAELAKAKNRVFCIAAAAAALLFFGAVTHERAKVWKSSLTLWSYRLKHYPNSHAAYIRRSDAFFKERKFAEAEADASKAISVFPHYRAGYAKRAYARYSLGNIKGAKDDIRRALATTFAMAEEPDLLKNWPAVYRLRGQINLDEKNYAQAERDFNSALALDGRQWKAHAGLGETYLATGDLHKAAEQFSAAIAINPDSAAYAGLADAEAAAGDCPGAMRNFAKAVELNPSATQLRQRKDSALKTCAAGNRKTHGS